VGVKPGICGICGVAVVQPTETSPGWYNGHLFERQLKHNQTKLTELVLVRVRCMSHRELGDNRYYDRDGVIRDKWPGGLLIW
jgi:hypothetical protein